MYTFVICWLFLDLTVLIAHGELSPVKNFPRFVQEPPRFAFGISNHSLTLHCRISCNCSRKHFTSWQRNGSHILSHDPSIQILSNGSLKIKFFDKDKHVGRYVCFVRYPGWATLRTKPCDVALADLPNISVKAKPCHRGGTAVLKCAYHGSVPKGLILQYNWYRDNIHLAPAKSDRFYVGTDGTLFVMNVHGQDQGHYHCQLIAPQINLSRTSPLHFWGVTQEKGSSMEVSHITKDVNVIEGNPFEIVCVILGPGKPLVRLFGHEHKGKWKKEGNYSVIYRRNNASKLDAGVYTCEIEKGDIKSRHMIVVKVLIKPVIDTWGIVSVTKKAGSPSTVFACDTSGAFPEVKLAFYRYGNQIVEDSHWSYDYGYVLHFTDVLTSDHGFYQCIVENEAGADSALYFLNVQDIGQDSNMSPRDVRFKALSPTQAMLTWKPPISGRPAYYLFLWTNLETKKKLEQFRENNSTTSYFITPQVADPGPHGGGHYRFSVCSIYSRSSSRNFNCSSVFGTMPEDKPLIAPKLYEPDYEGDWKVRIVWSSIPRHLSQGYVVKYTIHIERIWSFSTFGVDSIDVDGSAQSINLELKHSGWYKVFMTGSTSQGVSPKGKAYMFCIDAHRRLDLEYPSVTSQWRKVGSDDYVADISWNIHSNPFHRFILGYKASYVEITTFDKPQFKTTDWIPGTKNSITINSLWKKDRVPSYRIEVTPVYSDRVEGIPKSLGKSGVAILHQPLSNSRKFILVERPVVIHAPEDLQLVALAEPAIYISWNVEKITNKHSVIHEGYNVYLFETIDQTSQKLRGGQRFHTNLTWYLVDNLQEGRWYYIYVQAQGKAKNGDEVFAVASRIEACKTKDTLPSVPRNVQSKLVQLTSDPRLSLMITWKPPFKPGGVVMSYNLYISHLNNGAEPVSSLYKFEVTKESYRHLHKLVNVQEGFSYLVQIMAVNEAGQGRPANITTQVVAAKNRVILITTSIPPSGGFAYDINEQRLGVVVGCSLGGMLLFVLFVFFLVRRERYKKSVTVLIATGNDLTAGDNPSSFLYLQKLQQRERLLEPSICTYNSHVDSCINMKDKGMFGISRSKLKKDHTIFCCTKSSDDDKSSNKSCNTDQTCPVHGKCCHKKWTTSLSESTKSTRIDQQALNCSYPLKELTKSTSNDQEASSPHDDLTRIISKDQEMLNESTSNDQEVLNFSYPRDVLDQQSTLNSAAKMLLEAILHPQTCSLNPDEVAELNCCLVTPQEDTKDIDNPI